MTGFRLRRRRRGRPAAGLASMAWLAPAILAWAAGVAVAWTSAGSRVGLLILALGAGSIASGAIAWRRRERDRWIGPVRSLGRTLTGFNDEPGESWELPATPGLAEVVTPVRELHARYLALKAQAAEGRDDARDFGESGEFPAFSPLDARMTRSGAYEPPSGLGFEATATGEFSTVEMISRLDPKNLRWLESSPAEQEFLGWTEDELRGKCFLDILQDDDRRLARQQLKIALARGEGHGLVYRITTARGETRAIEMNVGVRYAPDHRVLHLRCHLADVTAKLRDETELKRRTQELIQTNDEMRRTNRELEELKDRYSDLYQNAPAMYFSVDRKAQILECNDTLTRTLGLDRHDLLGRPSTILLAPGRTPTPADQFVGAEAGSFEFGSVWSRASGGPIEVWVTGSAVVGPEGKVRQYRCVAQDITARRVLEAELQVKNERLAAANAELSRKNKELDEFTYVVSHDLQEPLRTLIAFSDFLMRDQGDRLDETGKEYVRYLVEASRRLRSLIQALLTLSRAGKVTADFALVNLDEVVDVLRADHAELIRSRNAEVRVLGPLPEVWGDRDRIGQLVANLVGNGLKYNQRPDPVVEIGARPDGTGRRVVLFVRDNGIGIDPQFHARIFQLFRRLHTREEYEGTGAGLAICQKIAQAHGGKIWVESEPEKGSTFYVTLPKPPPAVAARRTEILHAP